MIFRRKLARLSLKVWSSKGNLMDLGRVFHSFGPMTAKDVSYRVTERLVAIVFGEGTRIKRTKCTFQVNLRKMY